MRIQFKTLTPVFTGDESTNQAVVVSNDGRRAILREQGIIGSLRFWSGALLRGLGHKALSAIRDKPKLKSTAELDSLDSLTWTFGCTGWKRTFQLRISQPPGHEFGNEPLHLQTSSRHPHKGWYLKPGYWISWEQAVSIETCFRHGIDGQQELCRDLLSASWAVMSSLTGLGAHQGWGYGQVRLTNTDLTENIASATVRWPVGTEIHADGLPDLADFVFAEHRFSLVDQGLRALNTHGGLFKNEDKWTWPDQAVSPACLKKPVGLVLRYLLQNKDSRYQRSIISAWGRPFWGGSEKQEDPAGRFHGSYLYRTDDKGNPDPNGSETRLRVWAWLPKNNPLFAGSKWNSAADQLRQQLQDDLLWQAAAGCNHPDEVYFWPMNPANTIPQLASLSPILKSIEQRRKNLLGR